MAKTKRKPARQLGPIPTDGMWEDIFWIQERADHLRAWGQVYGVLYRAIADRFNRTYPPAADRGKSREVRKTHQGCEKRMA